MVAVFYQENKWSEEEVFLETRTGCTYGIRDSEWDLSYKIMYFQLLSQYMETGPRIAVLMNRFKKKMFFTPNSSFSQFDYSHNSNALLLFSVLQGVAQNPQAGSEGLISAWLQGKLYEIDLFQVKIMYGQKRD